MTADQHHVQGQDDVMDEWSDDDAPAWRRVHGIGRPFQPTAAAGRRGCMLLLGGGLVLILLVLLIIGLV